MHPFRRHFVLKYPALILLQFRYDARRHMHDREIQVRGGERGISAYVEREGEIQGGHHDVLGEIPDGGKKQKAATCDDHG
jgi:hypothetical protein